MQTSRLIQTINTLIESWCEFVEYKIMVLKFKLFRVVCFLKKKKIVLSPKEIHTQLNKHT